MPETYGTDDSFCGRLNPWAQAFFGPLPALTEPVSLVMSHQLHQSDRIWSQWQVRVGQPTWLTWTLHRVDPAGVFCPPLLLSPDGCWPHVLHSDAMAAVVGQGVALAWFNRTELAFDAPSCTRQGPVQDRWPEVPWSALSVWAWGLITCANALSQAEDRGFGKLGAVGHSRGGKAALLAALLNQRFDAVVAHNSGTGGAASLRVVGEGSETLQQLVERYPHWLAPTAADLRLQQQWVEEDAPLPWLANLAPRGLCVLQAEDDLWANPEGTRHLVESLKPMWHTHPHRLCRIARAGGHAMTTSDWQQAARFMKRL